MNRANASTAGLDDSRANGTRKLCILCLHSMVRNVSSKVLTHVLLLLLPIPQSRPVITINQLPTPRSLFIHYYPADWQRIYNQREVHYRIPPKWNDVAPPKPGLERLVMAETAAYEPDCEDTWCGLDKAIKWDVRGEFGKVLSGDGIVTGLNERFDGKKIRKPVHWNDEL